MSSGAGSRRIGTLFEGNIAAPVSSLWSSPKKWPISWNTTVSTSTVLPPIAESVVVQSQLAPFRMMSASVTTRSSWRKKVYVSARVVGFPGQSCASSTQKMRFTPSCPTDTGSIHVRSSKDNQEHVTESQVRNDLRIASRSEPSPTSIAPSGCIRY